MSPLAPWGGRFLVVYAKEPPLSKNVGFHVRPLAGMRLLTGEGIIHLQDYHSAIRVGRRRQKAAGRSKKIVFWNLEIVDGTT